MKQVGRGISQVSVRARVRQGLSAFARAGGVFHFVARLPDGRVLKWRSENILTNEGLVYGAEASFLDDTTGVDTWFIGLTDDAPTVAAADTLASHAGWAEFTNVTESPVRQAYVGVAHATPGRVTNAASPATFTLDTGGGTIGGAFFCSVQTGTSGILFAVSAFAEGDVTLPAASELDVTYVTGYVDDGV